MKKALLTACLLLWSIPASADWDLTIRCKGEAPTCTSPALVGPVVPPPPPPPPTCPPNCPPPPPPPPPVLDRTPFAFPTDCLKRPVFDYERTRFAWMLPGKAEDDPNARVYAYEDTTGNPSIASHQCLGIIKPGAITATGVPVGNLRAWGPISAGTEQPWHLRCILETGRLCP